MKATRSGGELNFIPNCDILIPIGEITFFGYPLYHEIKLRILPEITDSKSAAYQDEPVIGRSFPIKTYSHSENRSISMKLHFIILDDSDAITNLKHLRAIESATYPRTEAVNKPYLPPPVCKIRCGKLLAGGYLCAVLKQYSVNFPTDVAWYEENSIYLPYKFDVELSWDVVYPNENLPGQEKILKDF